ARFVFGDNLDRSGLMGQAGALRGEPNAIGIAIKWRSGMRDGDFFSDWNPSCLAIIRNDLEAVHKALNEGRKVYVPKDALGTRLSRLPTRAPALYEMLRKEFMLMAGEPCPWPTLEDAKDLMDRS